MAREFLGGPLVKTPQGLKISQATARPKEKKQNAKFYLVTIMVI